MDQPNHFILKTPLHHYLYSYKYDYHNTELCKLESRQLFDVEVKDKVLFSNNCIDPSVSPFIRNRLQILVASKSYSELIRDIRTLQIRIDAFKVEYLSLDIDPTNFSERQQ